MNRSYALAVVAALGLGAALVSISSGSAFAQRGTIIGGGVGAGVGAAIGRGRGRIGGAIGGALIGGVVGNEIEQNRRARRRHNQTPVSRSYPPRQR